VRQEGDLGIPTDEGERPSRWPTDAHQPPDRERADPLELGRAQWLELRGARGRFMGRRPDEDLARLGTLLQPGGDVHDRPDAHLLAGGRGGLEVDDRVAGLEPDPHGEGMPVGLARDAPLPERLGRTERPEGVVLVGAWRAEERVDRVADVLLDGATVLRDDPRELRERRAELALETLRAKPHRQLRRPHDVDEHAGHEAALLADGVHRRYCAASSRKRGFTSLTARSIVSGSYGGVIPKRKPFTPILWSDPWPRRSPSS